MKLAGVESADVSLEKASADIRLKPDNRITMTQLREVLKQNGYPTRDAQVEARGRIIQGAGKQVLDLLNGATLAVEGHAVTLNAGDAVVQVVGVSRSDGKAGEHLTVQSVK
jgi:hypothetical protein